MIFITFILIYVLCSIFSIRKFSLYIDIIGRKSYEYSFISIIAGLFFPITLGLILIDIFDSNCKDVEKKDVVTK